MTDHTSASTDDELAARLTAMGNELVLAAPRRDAAAAVLSRIDDEPNPASSGFGGLRAAADKLVNGVRRRRRMVLAVLLTVLLVALGASPVGAKVREWLGFGAVIVQEQGSAAAESSMPSGAPSEGTEIRLDQASTAVPFPVGQPALLPAPDRVAVSADGRLLTTGWVAGRVSAAAGSEVRLDQVSGELDPYFFKKYFPDVDFVRVDGVESLWLHQPHPIVVLNPDGSERSESARLSGPALVWQNGGVTLRLEGIADLATAKAIAESMTY